MNSAVLVSSDGGRRRRVHQDDAFFLHGNYERYLQFKLWSFPIEHLQDCELEAAERFQENISCKEIGCKQSFRTVQQV